jgi:hypothetical protein
MFKRLFGKKKSASATLPSQPDFIIVGAQKAATSSVFEALAQHPQFYLPEEKELHYFDFRFGDSKDSYLEKLSCPEGTKCGEASPFYAAHPQAIERIYSTFPKTKIIFIIRNPVDRAISHYRMNIQRGIEGLSPLQAMATEHIRLNDALKNDESWDNAESSLQNYSYQLRGFYTEQYKRILAHFPKNQVWVMRFEDLLSDPTEAMNALTKWLGVDSSGHEWGEFPHENASMESDFDESYARRFLAKRFEEEVALQKEIIELSFGSW